MPTDHKAHTKINTNFKLSRHRHFHEVLKHLLMATVRGHIVLSPGSHGSQFFFLKSKKQTVLLGQVLLILAMVWGCVHTRSHGQSAKPQHDQLPQAYLACTFCGFG